jgi:hypothetical protein
MAIRFGPADVRVNKLLWGHAMAGMVYVCPVLISTVLHLSSNNIVDLTRHVARIKANKIKNATY